MFLRLPSRVQLNSFPANKIKLYPHKTLFYQHQVFGVMQSYIDFHNHQTKRTEERNNQRGILHNNSILVLSYLKSIIQGTY